MKILAINNLYSAKHITSKQKVQKNQAALPTCSNISTNNINSTFLSFQGLEKTSLSERLSYALNKLDVGDFLVAAKNMKNISEALKNAEGRIKTIIEKLYILEEPQLKEVLFFYATPSGEKEFWNANEFPIRHNGFDQILPDEVIRIEDGDRLKFSTKWVDISEHIENPSDVLEKEMESRIQIKDFSNNAQKTIDLHNKKVLALALNTSKADKENKKLSFEKVGGQDEVIKALKRNILFPLKYPEVFEGFMLSRGGILYGPPGTGKTLLAKALIAESGASAFEQCATEFEAKYVGESEQNCRELFRKAVDAQPSIIFLDEIDALGKSRGKDVHGDKLLNQFLSCMSELEKNGDRVFVIGATNNEKDLDAALIRAGRLDLKLECKAPDLEGTKQVFEIHIKGKPIDEKLDKETIIKKMHLKNMTGADIAATVTNAHVRALERAEIYKSMDEGRFSPSMLDFFRIKTEDFENAIENFKNGNVKKHNPIGFNKRN